MANKNNRFKSIIQILVLLLCVCNTSSAQNEVFSDLRVDNFADFLNGRIAGMQVLNINGNIPGSTPDVIINGRNTPNDRTQPLIILDGVPFYGDWNTINPQFIDQVSVMSNAEAAIYGNDARNGVILINTKSAKKDGIHVTFDANWGVNSLGTPTYETIDDVKEYFTLANKIRPGYLAEYELSQIGTLPKDIEVFDTNGNLNPNFMSNFTFGRKNTSKNGVEYWLKPERDIDDFYKNGSRQEYNANIMGRFGNLDFVAAIGKLNSRGIVDQTGFKRIIANIKLNYKFSEWLRAGINTSFNRSETDNNDLNYMGSMYEDYLYSPFYPLYCRNEDGKVMCLDKNDPMSKYEPFEQYPPAKHPMSTTEKDVYLLNANITVTPIRDLEIRLNATRNINKDKTGLYSNIKFDYPLTIEMLDHYEYYDDYTSDISFTTLSPTIRYSHYNYLTDIGYGVYAGYENIDNTEDSRIIDLGNNYIERIDQKYGYNKHGYFGKVWFNYKNFRMNASYRHDNSDYMYSMSNDNYNVYASWSMPSKFTSYHFNNFTPWVSYGKMGSGFGYLYPMYINVYNEENYPHSVVQNTKSFTVGTRFGFFNDRIYGNIWYYINTTDNERTNGDRWFYYGTSYGPNLFCTIRNQGVNASIHADIIEKRPITWSMDVNLSTISNKVTSGKFTMERGSVGSNIKTNEDAYNWYLRKYDPNATLETLGERENCGSSLPDLYGGFATKLSWQRKIDFKVLFSFSVGGKVYDTTYGDLIGNYLHKDVKDTYYNNPDKDVRNIIQLQCISDYCLTNASWLSLSNISIGYNLPKKVAEKMYMSNIRLYCSANNLAFWSARKGLDPRVTEFGVAKFNLYPQVRTICGGINISF